MKRCKKLICCIFLFLFFIHTSGMTICARASENGTAQVPIIMYHSLLDKKTHQWNISPNAFEKDLKYLSENAYQAVFMSDLIAYVYEGAPLPENPIVLTFDDGYYNNYSYGLPLLEKYDMKMVLSVIGSNTDHWTEHEGETDERYGHLTWPQIAEMVGTGRIELANHTQNLHNNTTGRDGCCRKKGEDLQEYERLLTEDAETLQNKLEQISGKRPECFTYPFGSKSKESVDILKKLGFKATLSCASGVNNLRVGDPECLISLKRNNRTSTQPVEDILKKIEK